MKRRRMNALIRKMSGVDYRRYKERKRQIEKKKKMI